MALTTSLPGRVKNTSLPMRHALLPLYEAVVNAIQAVDAQFTDDLSGGGVLIEILRSPQGVLPLDAQGGPGRVALEPITGFQVSDNGIGFTEENMTSFETLDSGHKAVLGCRGIGRLLWLKAFDRAKVASRYEGRSGGQVELSFTFNIADGVALHQPPQAAFAGSGTQVQLDGFKKNYQKSAPKTLVAIARGVLDHCLWYFIRPGGVPRMEVRDGGESVSLNRLFEEFVTRSTERMSFTVKDQSFELVSLRLESGLDSTPRLHWCAASRVVIEENLTGKVPGLYGRLRSQSAGGEFSYVGFLTSDYLDENVRPERTDFDIPASSVGTLMEEELSIEDIRAGALEAIAATLREALAASIASGKDRVDAFVRTTAPRYRPLIARFNALGMDIDPDATDKELELQLHRNLREVELEMIQEGQEVLDETDFTDLDEYKDKLQAYLEKVEEIKKSDLAAYVTRRRVVLDILRKAIEADEHGRFAREDAVHSLLMPMRRDSNEISAEASNLWIIDERLAFHEYLASDKTLNSMPITDSTSPQRPDLVALNVVDSPILVSEGKRVPLASIVVVEIKRPLRNDATSDDKNPISQALSYLERVRDGQTMTASGRPIPLARDIPAYCYIIADLTPTMIMRCKDAGLQMTQDASGFFGYNIARQAYVEVLSFDRLLNGAQERNRAFFDQLGLPASL